MKNEKKGVLKFVNFYNLWFFSNFHSNGYAIIICNEYFVKKQAFSLVDSSVYQSTTTERVVSM